MGPQTNLRKLCSGRGNRPSTGDVFAFTPFEDEFLVGRVLIAHAPQGQAPMPGANLIFLYKRQFSIRPTNLDAFALADLLVPPIWTNDQAWTRGYFQTLQIAGDRWAKHAPKACFYRAPLRPDADGWHVDQYGNRVERRWEPCGDWGLVSYRWIDDRVSDALGITRTPA